MKITIHCAASEQYWGLMQQTAQNKAEYAARHGYNLCLKKYVAFPSLLYERQMSILEDIYYCDWLFFMGVDTLITNMTVKLETIIGNTGANFIMSEDMNGINNDIMLIKNETVPKNWLINIALLYNFYRTDQLAQKMSVMGMEGLNLALVPQRTFNSMPYELYDYPKDKVDAFNGSWRQGDFILHAPGLTNEQRQELFDKRLKEVVR